VQTPPNPFPKQMHTMHDLLADHSEQFEE